MYVFEEECIGKYCIDMTKKASQVVLRIQTKSISLNVMHIVVRNKLFWPEMKDNVVWYEYTDIITFIPELQGQPADISK